MSASRLFRSFVTRVRTRTLTNVKSRGGTALPPVFRQDFEHSAARTGFLGPLQGVVLDWSGTTVDPHVLAPSAAFVTLFANHGVSLTMREAREPMGLRKDMHLAELLLHTPAVRTRWAAAHNGNDPTEDDVSALFAEFVPLQLDLLRQPLYSTLLPGVAEVAHRLRDDMGLKIGTTTGFTKAMVDVLLQETVQQGYAPDASVAGDEIAGDQGTRPLPFMLFRNMQLLGIDNTAAVLKVDDTAGGIGEGLNAGCWTCGVARYSTYTNVDSQEMWDTLSEEERERRVLRSRARLLAAGAHYVVDDLQSLPDVVQSINLRLSNGEAP